MASLFELLFAAAEPFRRGVKGAGEALGEDLAAGRDAFVANMQRAAGQGTLGEGETDASARAQAGTNLAGLAMTGAMPGGVFAAPRGALGVGPIKAYHGSPHDFDRFDISKIGTGEGNQSYGHGLYFAENKGVAKAYRDALSENLFDTVEGKMRGPDLHTRLTKAALEGNPGSLHAAETIATNTLEALQGVRTADRFLKAYTRPEGFYAEPFAKTYAEVARLSPKRASGRMYEVAIHADPEKFLSWDVPLGRQAAEVQDIVRQALPRMPETATGAQVVDALKNRAMSGLEPSMRKGLQTYAPDASFELARYGAPGIRYQDQGSRLSNYDAASMAKNFGRAEALTIAQDRFKNASPGDLRYWDQIVKELSKPVTHNYVVFDDKLVEILKKYGLFGLAAGGGALALDDAQASAPVSP